MGGGDNKLQETPQQRASAEYFANMMQDYKQRWLPVQQNLAAHIQEMGQPGSAERTDVAGRAATDTAIQFGKAQGQVEKGLSNAGATPGSGRFDLATTGTETDAAKSRGLGTVAANTQVTDAYLQGLQALAATGRGEKASVSNSLTNEATMSGNQAAADAQNSLESQMGTAGVVGQLAGYGIKKYLPPGTPNLPKSVLV